MGLLMVQGQSVMVRVVACSSSLAAIVHNRVSFEDSYLSDSVGVGAVGDLGGARAVGLVGGNDLGGVGGSVRSSRRSSNGVRRDRGDGSR